MTWGSLEPVAVTPIIDALDRANASAAVLRGELAGIKIGDTVVGGPLLELDLGHALVYLDEVDKALERAGRNARLIEAPL